jgi:3-hydroxyisobutyrate dehydrogenase-like beta-hydroxyacid dehydrogenase
MKTTKKYYPALFCAGLIAFSIGNGMAQNSSAQAGDPARWYVEDVTAEARLRTMKKEMGAAQDEAKRECKRMPAAQRSPCLQDARAAYLRDMAGAQQDSRDIRETPGEPARAKRGAPRL